MDELNKFSKRVKRYASLGTSAGSFAFNFLGSRIFNKENQENAEELTRVLGNLKGPIMKIAQLLSTVPDLLPREYAVELTKLQSSAPPMGWNFVKRRMTKELGVDWIQKFEVFEKEPYAAASLGQVHKAVYKNKKIVCKLQYPDMLSIVEADISQLKLLFSIYKRIDKTIDTTEIQKEISSRVREELDYSLEQKHMKLFSFIFDKNKKIHIPYVLNKISTKRLLSMNYLEGKKLLEFKKESEDSRKELAKNMFYAWYYPFYKYGAIHGDPHLGNYSANNKFEINLLDFGCIRIFKPSFVEGVINLYHAIMHNDEDLAVSAYESWGF